MTTILVLGGHGAVGRHAVGALAAGLPGATLLVGGRNPRPVPGARPVRVDATDPAALAAALEGVDTVLMCAELDNARVARACLERGIDYLDVTASHAQLAAIEDLHDLAVRNEATAVLSVGLVPGVTNLLARHVAERDPAASELRIGVLLGAGERHGPAALAWTLDGLGVLDGSWPMTFPAPYGRRTVHRFPFADQFTLPGTLGVPHARTGLCLDSGMLTGVLAAARIPALARLLRHRWVRRSLERVHIGGDGFAVTVSTGRAHASFTGRAQSRATGRVAAQLIGKLPALPPGVGHIEQLVDPAAFLTTLAAGGFDLSL
ncbi:NAD(P)H-binding protein [Nonomuraea sp. NPDC050310]|uniref:saccharopine dehydrogenase family protein n=1 Tax=Nonomuraea sp. NPDC050310 TaxID=3154935 RepID=UPI0033E25F8E